MSLIARERESRATAIRCRRQACRSSGRWQSADHFRVAFDPARSALLLLGGDKAGNWQRWYRQNIPVAEQLYLEYTTELEE
jgi:hypothetical protein